jgi:hypothetical protein
MEKYLLFKNLTLNLAFKIAFLSVPLASWALAGRQAENGPQTSSQLTVRHVLDMQRPPFINLTPSRPTIVQFPAEVSNCVIKSNLISLTYGNGEGAQQSGNTTQTSGTNSIYSAVTLSVQSVENFTYDDLINTPETYMICSIRSNKSDSFCAGYDNNQSTYCYVTVGIKIEDTNHYNAIVYLDKPGSVSALPPIPSKLSRDSTEFDPVILPHKNEEQIRKKAIIVKKSDPESEPSFKIIPLPKNQFKDDRSLGLKADMALNE